MNASNEPPKESNAEPASVPPEGGRDGGERIEECSIRIVLESNSSLRCDACGSAIDDDGRHRVVTVRDGSGGVTEYTFCDEGCRNARFPSLGTTGE